MPTEQSASPCMAATDLVYDLRLGSASSDAYYEEIARFSDTTTAEIERQAGTVVDGYRNHILDFLREDERSRGEYALDLLMMGLALGRYLGAAEKTPKWVVGLARELFWLRRESAWSKPLADLGRAVLGRFFLAPQLTNTTTAAEFSLNRLPRLIDWLQATGEFEQEVRRLNNWRSFLGTLPEEAASRCMRISFEVFTWFEREAAITLEAYTRGVPGFLTTEYSRRGLREDQVFCGMRPAEYHLSMVAAEIMNRGLRRRFDQTTRKAVLVPGCMRGELAKTCRARVLGIDVTCTGCDKSCSVNRITEQMRNLGVEVYIVPKSTGFSRWIERWQGERNTGVVAVACVLNILPGGHEMRARCIPSQCVPLDYPGCEKHWRREGIPTGVNEDRLVKILTPPGS